VEVERLRQLLEAVRAGTLGVDDALHQLRDLPYESLGFARVDHHRALRKGFPEVVLGQGKTPEQLATLVERLAARGRVLATRISPEQYAVVQARVPHAVYHAEARLLTVGDFPEAAERPYGVVLSAGTADIPVAQEASLTARFMGVRVETLFDVGVAGVHRVLAHRALLMEAGAVVVVAGMEGALPSVIGGLVALPGDWCAHQRRLWRPFRRAGAVAHDAQHLCPRRVRGQYRQRLRRRLPDGAHPAPTNSSGNGAFAGKCGIMQIWAN
jgi:NCAIR mutase (PurE)-related protein